MTTTKPSRLRQALIETAEDMRRAGIMDDVTYQQITTRHLRAAPPKTATPISAEDIRRTRKREHLSQAALASYLDVTVGYVSQLERGVKEAKGPVRTLLNVIRNKGLEPLQ